ncbi:MAG: helix-turn-helix transcriptional regulator [Bradyrhizobium sp.]|nr:helix-turn-helix transcriptional regulator [Bradyrhizobium sp.]
MTGDELKAWRKGRGWTQSDLMKELEVTARQTVVRWEQSERIPRLVELSIIALDQVEGCNSHVYEKQFSSSEIANRWFDRLRRAKELEESWQQEAALEAE